MSYLQEKEALLQSQVIPQNMQPDFAAFWEAQIAFLRSIPLKVTREKLDTPYDKTFTTYAVTFNTHDATVVDALFSVPVNRDSEKLPCVALYHGGGGAKEIWPGILATGVCCFAMDVRAQGGTTPDRADYSTQNSYGEVMTRDLLRKESCYMRNIYLDAVRAVDVIASMPEVDGTKIVSHGTSQGGALSIAAAALSGRICKCYPSVTSYACIRERVDAGSGVFGAVKTHLRKHPEQTDQALETLSYFDVNNLVSLLRVPAAFLLGLDDPICLPRFVYSPYHHTPSPKQIMLAPYSPHALTTQFADFMYNELARM